MKAYVVDTAALRNNIHIVQERAGQAVIWAVLKGNRLRFGHRAAGQDFKGGGPQPLLP